MTATRQLRCPACLLANDVPSGVAPEDVRCAGCQAPLDDASEVRYHVARGSEVLGPLPHSKLVDAIRAGSVRRDMLVSEEGGPWVPGEERPDLFPKGPVSTPADRLGRPPPERVSPNRARRAPQAPPPGVVAMAVLDHICGGICVLLFLVALGFAEYLLNGEGVLLYVLLVVLAAGHFVLGVGLVKGWGAARVLQLVLAALGILILLPAIFQGDAGSVFAVVGLLVGVLPFLLLLNGSANAFFRR